jgi:hypothetical protein
LAGAVIVGIAAALVLAGCGKKDSGDGGQASASGEGAKAAKQLTSVLDQVLAAADAAGADEAAALFADLLKTASVQEIAGLNAKASPGGDFTYDLNEEGDGIIVKGYTGTSPVMIIPAEIEGYPVVEVGENFRRHPRLIAVVIPENVRKIGSGAFMDSGISAITLPSSLTVIEEQAFSSSNISAVTFPSSSNLTVIGKMAFFGCKNLQTVTFPSSLTVIEQYAFSEADKLSEVDLSHTGLTRIAARAFEGCDQLQTVKLPDSVTEIEGQAFSRCPSLTSINIPAGIQSIGTSPAEIYNAVGGVFWECRELYNLTIPDSVTSIKFFKKKIAWFEEDDGKGSTDFEGCSKLLISTRKRLQELGYTGEF